MRKMQAAQSFSQATHYLVGASIMAGKPAVCSTSSRTAPERSTCMPTAYLELNLSKRMGRHRISVCIYNLQMDGCLALGLQYIFLDVLGSKGALAAPVKAHFAETASRQIASLAPVCNLVTSAISAHVSGSRSMIARRATLQQKDLPVVCAEPRFNTCKEAGSMALPLQQSGGTCLHLSIQNLKALAWPAYSLRLERLV